MLAADKIGKIAEDAAVNKLGRQVVERAFAAPITDSGGNDAWQITIVIKPNTAARLSGDNLLDTLHDIQTRLLSEGESRLPILEYATQAELEQVGSS